MDNFIQYNLSFGKYVGDKILVIIGQCINVVIDGDLKVYCGIGDNFFIFFIVLVDGENCENESIINILEWEIYKVIVMFIVVDDLIYFVIVVIFFCCLEVLKVSYEKVNGVFFFGKKWVKK